MVTLTINPETLEEVRRCIPLYIDAHPELRGKKISLNHIVMQIALYYKK